MVRWYSFILVDFSMMSSANEENRIQVIKLQLQQWIDSQVSFIKALFINLIPPLQHQPIKRILLNTLSSKSTTIDILYPAISLRNQQI